MGWTYIRGKHKAGLGSALRTVAAAALLAFAAPGGQAQLIGTTASLTNGTVTLTLGGGIADGGTISLKTGTGNPFDAAAATLLTNTSRVTTSTVVYPAGTIAFLRVDGGINGGQGGYDYEIGNPNIGDGGQWLTVPTVVGSHIVARWATYAVINTSGTGTGIGGSGSGNTTLGTTDPHIEVDMLLSIVHNQARIQYNIINNDVGNSHFVGMVFKEDPLVNPTDATVGAPIRLPNRPYLRTETLLTGSDIPAYWESLFLGVGNAGGTRAVRSRASGTTPNVHSIMGTLRPTATSGTEPTVPSRFALGRSTELEGDTPYPLVDPNNVNAVNLAVPSPTVRYYDDIWNFTPKSSNRFDTAGSVPASIALYFDQQAVAPGQTLPITVYAGQGESSVDLGTPISLVVTSPDAINFSASAFTISAYVTNLLDLQPGGGIALSPVSVTLDLPAGLALAAGDTPGKTIQNIAPGGEGSASWNVVADGTYTGLTTYTVTAGATVGNGKTVQRSVFISAPPAIDLVGNARAKGLYQMASFPLDFQGATISSILYGSGTVHTVNGVTTTYTTQNTSLTTPDIAKYNPATGRYESATTFQLGQAYWIRSRETTDDHIQPSSTYQDLSNQVQPTATAFKATYDQGWNQVANPYVAPINFSEVQIFDPSTLAITSVADSSSVTNQLVSPAVYEFDTSDPDPAKWHYVLEPSVGFQMQPYKGYWVFVNRSNLQFLYSGVDTPGFSASRAALMGVGFSKKTKSKAIEVLGQGTSSNWRLKISAQSASGYDPDNYIGVAPNATDSKDGYKYPKPPAFNSALSLDIVHNEWDKNTRYAHDLRSPALTDKTWNLVARSAKPGENVTLTWSGIARDVPRNYSLTLVDTVSGQRVNMRRAASHIAATGADGTRTFQVVAEPAGSHDAVEITSLDVVSNTPASRGVAQSANIHFGVVGDGEPQVVIRNGRGQIIRTLNVQVTKAASGVASGSVLWDMKTQQGAAVATGPYQVELTVRSATGRSARRMTTMLITR